MPPSYLVQQVFLGQPCGAGVNPVMQQILSRVEGALRDVFAQSGDPGTFEAWGGLREPIIGWRANAGFHSSGSAIDVNVTTNPYIVTRTGSTLGGEAGTPNASIVRQQAVDVFDRAVQFQFTSSDTADVSIRVNDTIEFTYDRFRTVSDALVFYFSFVIRTSDTRINRPPIPNAASLPNDESAFSAFPLSERLSLDEATSDLAARLNDANFQATHPGFATDVAPAYFQMLRDFECVRMPMLFGNPAAAITATRNPSIGFLDLRKELVAAMINVAVDDLSGVQKMRWGAADFGANESGDVMHFDTFSHCGFAPQNT